MIIYDKDSKQLLIPDSLGNNVVEYKEYYNIVECTQAEYDSMEHKNNTVYLITV